MAQEAGYVVPSTAQAPVIDREPLGPTPAVLRTCQDAEAYVASVCFKHGPPTLMGVELEWLLHRPAAPHAPVGVATLVTALGPHAPITLNPDSPALPLPSGSSVTVEPGGQVELASPPLPDLGQLIRSAGADADALHRLLAAEGVQPQPRAADPVRPPSRLLDTPRYRAMEQAFDRIGPYGRSGMCSTAAVQICLDAGEGGRRRPALAGSARARPGPARRVRQLAADARPPDGLEVVAVGELAGAGPGPDGTPARRGGRPGGGMGPARAADAGAVRPDGTGPGTCPTA